MIKMVYVYTKYILFSNLFLGHARLKLSCIREILNDLLSWNEIVCHQYCELKSFFFAFSENSKIRIQTSAYIYERLL